MFRLVKVLDRYTLSLREHRIKTLISLLDHLESYHLYIFYGDRNYIGVEVTMPGAEDTLLMGSYTYMLIRLQRLRDSYEYANDS